MLDWFPEHEDTVRFISLLHTLTSVVNVHKMLAVIYDCDVNDMNLTNKSKKYNS